VAVDPAGELLEVGDGEQVDLVGAKTQQEREDA